VGSLVPGEASNKIVPQFLAVLFYFTAALTKAQKGTGRFAQKQYGTYALFYKVISLLIRTK
jgi:hypothetical protein